MSTVCVGSKFLCTAVICLLYLSVTLPPCQTQRLLVKDGTLSAEMIQVLDDKACLPNLDFRAALEQASLAQQVKGNLRRAVVLTTCDLRCLRELAGLFLASVHSTKKGGFTQHVVIIAAGLPAYEYCDSLRTGSGYKHRCVLDPYCHDRNSSMIRTPAGNGDHTEGTRTMAYQSNMYVMATIRKVVWVREALELGYSTFFVDVDVFLNNNPLSWLLTTFHDADLAVSGENCEPLTAFQGDFLKWQPGGVFSQNIGQYFMNPTPNALTLMGVWIERVKLMLLKNHYATGQTELNHLMNKIEQQHNPGEQTSTQRAINNQSTGHKTQTTAAVARGMAMAQHMMGMTREPSNDLTWAEFGRTLNVYRIGFNRMDSYCKQTCGCETKTWTARLFKPLQNETIMCDMSQEEHDELFGFHYCCISTYQVKQQEFERRIGGKVVPRPADVPSWTN